MPGLGELKKLHIFAFKQPDYHGLPFGYFKCPVNPTEISFAYKWVYDETQGVGNTNSRMEFEKAKPGDFSLTIFIDGTGASGAHTNVQMEVAKFHFVTGYNGDIHRPSYLIVAWGTLPVMRCVLKSATVVYKLFSPKGEPLRAVITASFGENSDDKTSEAVAKNKSPDLTHLRLVKGGDNLPGMCFQIYGDPRYYLEVARANRIDDFRRLEPGRKIFFPPLKK
jgi:hypothetical protein